MAANFHQLRLAMMMAHTRRRLVGVTNHAVTTATATFSFQQQQHLRSIHTKAPGWKIPKLAAMAVSVGNRPRTMWTAAPPPPREQCSSLMSATSDETRSSLLPSLQSPPQNVRIFYASQGGTAQMFANQLQDEFLEDYNDENNEHNEILFSTNVTVQGCHEIVSKNDPKDVHIHACNETIHVFFVSCAGAGEPPENGRAFYESIMNRTEPIADEENKFLYCVFGLGNAKAHPHHYNAVGIALDEQLAKLGGTRVMDIGLGDDGDCIEDDADQWMRSFLEKYKVISLQSNTTEPDEQGNSINSSPPEAEISEAFDFATPSSTTATTDKDMVRFPCLAGVARDGKSSDRRGSKTHPPIALLSPQSDIIRNQLFFLRKGDNKYHPNSFYTPETACLDVNSNRLLTVEGGESGLHEMKISLVDHEKEHESFASMLKYETGDHVIIYPRNSDAIVQAYLRELDVDPHAIVSEWGQQKKYPFPKGLTIYETLSHCIDLGAVPSPMFSRMILGERTPSTWSYKEQIAIPRRTVIDLLLQTGTKLSLEDFLYNAHPMKPRYYSIASSSAASPDEIRIVFRPVKYMTNKGYLREGVCTSYLTHKGAIGKDKHAMIAASINHNPSFRLPQDPSTPVLFLAGGCGIAPIRAFLEERIYLAKEKNVKFGTGLAFLGFRSPSDNVYDHLVQEALQVGALTSCQVSFSTSGNLDVDGLNENNKVMHDTLASESFHMNVTDVIREEAETIWDFLEHQDDSITYMCGGARTIGVAMEVEFLKIIQEYGKLSLDDAYAYLRKLSASGRLQEDLAD